jgi:hypothetical protein
MCTVCGTTAADQFATSAPRLLNGGQWEAVFSPSVCFWGCSPYQEAHAGKPAPLIWTTQHGVLSYFQLQVLLLSDYGLSAPTPRARPLQPLHLPDPDPLLTHLAAESAAYWGGLQALTGAPLLAAQQSLDVVLDPERDHAGALGFSKLQVWFSLWGPVRLLCSKPSLIGLVLRPLLVHAPRADAVVSFAF